MKQSYSLERGVRVISLILTGGPEVDEGVKNFAPSPLVPGREWGCLDEPYSGPFSKKESCPGKGS